jgi:hypothetical protein
MEDFIKYKYPASFDSARLQNRIIGVKDFVDFDNSVQKIILTAWFCLSTICSECPGKMVGTAPHASFWLMRTEKCF